MTVTIKGKKRRYDNIAIGSALTSRERAISGALGPDNTVRGNTENIAVGTDYGSAKEKMAIGVIAPLIERP